MNSVKLRSRVGTDGVLNMMIAAIALANDLTLVTHNAREFGRADGLKSKIGKYPHSGE